MPTPAARHHHHHHHHHHNSERKKEKTIDLLVRWAGSERCTPSRTKLSIVQLWSLHEVTQERAYVPCASDISDRGRTPPSSLEGEGGLLSRIKLAKMWSRIPRARLIRFSAAAQPRSSAAACLFLFLPSPFHIPARFRRTCRMWVACIRHALTCRPAIAASGPSEHHAAVVSERTAATARRKVPSMRTSETIE